MKKNIIVILFFLLFFVVAVQSVKAANLQNASGTLNEAQFKKTSILTLQFTTSSPIPRNGLILITLPTSPGFNMKSIDSPAITITSIGCSNSWSTNKITKEEPTGSIQIARLNSDCAAGSTITVTIGNSVDPLINPGPKNGHQNGKADIYGVNIRSLDVSGDVIDEIIIKVALIESTSTDVNVVAIITGKKFVLFGFASPKSTVFIDGKKLHENAISDETGYFQFGLNSNLLANEVCLVNRDQFGRTSAPLCLPPFPKVFTANIGPVIIPPTVSFDKKNYYMGDEVKLTGQTIPNSTIHISFFVDERKSMEQFLTHLHGIDPVFAFTIPALQVVSDAKGNFSLSLPSSTPEFFRLFAQTNYLESRSQQSNVLHLKILPIWFIIISFLLGLFNLLSRHLFTIFILLQLTALIIFILRRYLHPLAISKNRALALRENEALMIQERFDLLVENIPLARRENNELVEAEVSFLE